MTVNSVTRHGPDSTLMYFVCCKLDNISFIETNSSLTSGCNAFHPDVADNY